jgi:hypothetical protein
MRPTAVSVVLATLLLAASASAGTFIVPADEELVAKSTAVVTGTVEGSFVQATETTIETINEIRIERAMKGRGLRPGTLLRVVTLGGVLEDGRGLLVPGEARFRHGERVLLFLTEDDGRWRATDLTLGKFKFVTSTAGDRLLVRDMEDVVGWDRAGNPHREHVRREEGFLRFVEERAKGRPVAATDYMVEASEVTLETDDQQFAIGTNAAPFPGATYTSWVNNQPNRWPNMAAGVTFYKRSDQNIAGAADGGVAAIQSGLAAWTNECGSVINLGYGGQAGRASANHDGANMVEYNDPQGRVSGSWGGSGTIAITFISFAGEHTFEGRSWLNITDADVVFQDGYPATNAAYPAAMTHELGHGLGFRHSNQNHATGGACNPSVEECTSAAIMNSAVSGSYGYTLQPWDINAAQSVYPGGTCGPVCSPPVISGQPQSQTVTPGTQVTLSVAATGTAGPFTYQWYIGTSGNTANPISDATTSSITVTPGTTTSYWVQVSSGCGSTNSSTATVTVTTVALASATAASLYLVTPCRVIDTRGGPPNYSQNVQLVQITGRCGIPAGAKSVVLNIAAVAPSANGYLIVYPGTGEPPPNTSTLSYRANRTRANNSVMRLSSDGRLSVFNGGPAVHFLIDVTGYFQ